MRELAGTLVRHAIVAEKGLSATVWTSSIVGAGGGGGAGVVVVVGAGGGGEVEAAPGSARNLSSPADGEPNAPSADGVAAEAVAARATVCASTRAIGTRPGPEEPLVSRGTGRTGRPLGGAKVSGGFDPVAGAAADGTSAELDPGRPSVKPIAEPATTASSSQRVARRGTR
jgi:hypothetical protein